MQHRKFRTWIREKLSADIEANPRDRAFLDEKPWLKQLIPLGASLRMRPGAGNAIIIQRLDAQALLKDKSYDSGVYFVAADGNVIAKSRGRVIGPYCTIRKAEAPYHCFERLRERAMRVRHIVVVRCNGPVVVNYGRIRIYNFPKDEVPTVAVARILGEHRNAQTRENLEQTVREADDYAQGLAAAK